MTDDQLPKTTFQKTAARQSTVDIAEFVDINSGRMLAPMSVNLVGMGGKPLMKETRLKLNEAMVEARRWWDTKGRFAMPDRPKVKGDEYLSQYGVASGVLLGYPWDSLAKDEKLSVLKAWWFNVGVVQYGVADSNNEGVTIQ